MLKHIKSFNISLCRVFSFYLKAGRICREYLKISWLIHLPIFFQRLYSTTVSQYSNISVHKLNQCFILKGDQEIQVFNLEALTKPSCWNGWTSMIEDVAKLIYYPCGQARLKSFEKSAPHSFLNLQTCLVFYYSKI